MSTVEKDPEREARIMNEIVVDAHDGEEQASGWFSYLENQIQFPFTASCIARRPISPLKVGDEVDVTGLAGEECMHEMFVTIRWEKDGLAVPLSQLEPVQADEDTEQAVADWHYWVARGYEF